MDTNILAGYFSYQQPSKKSGTSNKQIEPNSDVKNDKTVINDVYDIRNPDKELPSPEESKNLQNENRGSETRYNEKLAKKGKKGKSEIIAEKKEREVETSPNNLSEEQVAEVNELKARDAEVKTHEQAHVAAGGPYITDGPTYEYDTGPDGQKYAVGGHVGIDTSEIKDDPEATIEKAKVIKKAALAPANPSGTDRAVAAKASEIESSARGKLAKKNSDKNQTSKAAGIYSEKMNFKPGRVLDISV